MKRNRSSLNLASASFSKNGNGRRSLSASFRSKSPEANPEVNAIYDAIMKDPKNRAALMKILSKDKNIKTLLKPPTPVNKLLKKFHCESPTALHRRRALEKLRKQEENKSANCDSDPESQQDSDPSPVPFDKLLNGVIAYVDVKTSAGDRSDAVKATLRDMGATVRDVFVRDVTHVIYKDGSFATYHKAKMLKKHLVNLLWIEAVKTKGCLVPEKNFPVLSSHSADASVLCQKMHEEYEEALEDEYKRMEVLKSRRKTALPSELRKASERSRHSSAFIPQKLYDDDDDFDFSPDSQDKEVQSILLPHELIRSCTVSLVDCSQTADEVVEETREDYSSGSSDCGMMINGEIAEKIIEDIQINSFEEQANVINFVENATSSTDGSISVLSRKSLKEIHKNRTVLPPKYSRRQSLCCGSHGESGMEITNGIGTFLMENIICQSSPIQEEVNERNTRDSSATKSLEGINDSLPRNGNVNSTKNGQMSVVNRSNSKESSKTKNTNSPGSQSDSRNSLKTKNTNSLDSGEMSSLRVSGHSNSRNSDKTKNTNSLDSGRKSALRKSNQKDSSGEKRGTDSLESGEMSSLRISDGEKENSLPKSGKKIPGLKKRQSEGVLKGGSPPKNKKSDGETSKKDVNRNTDQELEQIMCNLRFNSESPKRKDDVQKKSKRKLYDPSKPPDKRLFENGDCVLNKDEDNLKKPVTFYTPAVLKKNFPKKKVQSAKTQGKLAFKTTKGNAPKKEVPPAATPPQKKKIADENVTKRTPRRMSTATPTRKSVRLSEAQSNVEEIRPLNRRSTAEFMTVAQTQMCTRRVAVGSPEKRGGIVCTRLHRPEVEIFKQIVSKLKSFTVEDEVSKKTTHLVVGEPKRTINLMRAVAQGCWVLKHEWLLRSLEAGKWLPEERYELTEFSPSVQRCRIERQAFGKGYSMNVFANCGYIYVAKSTIPRCSDLQELVVLCKGKITKLPGRAKIAVGELVRGDGVVSVREAWILDCITDYKLKPFKNYLMVD